MDNGIPIYYICNIVFKMNQFVIGGIMSNATEHSNEEDIFRNLSKENQSLIRDIKGVAIILSTLIERNPNHASSLAMADLETAIMWAIQGVCAGDSPHERRHHEKRN